MGGKGAQNDKDKNTLEGVDMLDRKMSSHAGSMI